MKRAQEMSSTMGEISGYLGNAYRDDWASWTAPSPGIPGNMGVNQTYPWGSGLPGAWQQVVGQVTTNQVPTPAIKTGPTYNINVIIVAGQDAERIQVNDSLKDAISKAVVEALQVAADEDTLEAFTQD
jgi:hypothetical protein